LLLVRRAHPSPSIAAAFGSTRRTSGPGQCDVTHDTRAEYATAVAGHADENDYFSRKDLAPGLEV
jgi:hypothetical protein